jgi:hypothetical protein
MCEAQEKRIGGIRPRVGRRVLVTANIDQGLDDPDRYGGGRDRAAPRAFSAGRRDFPIGPSGTSWVSLLPVVLRIRLRTRPLQDSAGVDIFHVVEKE